MKPGLLITRLSDLELTRSTWNPRHEAQTSCLESLVKGFLMCSVKARFAFSVISIIAFHVL